MELALNVVWLVLAAISLLLWGVYALSGRPRRAQFPVFIALLCILCFLFPVISMSDDLSNSPALFETSKLKKWVSAGLAEALLLSAPMAPARPRPVTQAQANLQAEVCFPLHEIVCSNLDRRPPPQRS